MCFSALRSNSLQWKHFLSACYYATNKRDEKFELKMRSLITAAINDFFSPHLYFKYRNWNSSKVLSLRYKHKQQTLVNSLAYLL